MYIVIMICGLKNDIPFINMLRALYIYHLYYMLVIPLPAGSIAAGFAGLP